MKKSLLLPALLFAGAAHAQTNVLKVDIFQPIINTVAVSFEHKLSPSSSFQLGVAGTFGYKESGGFYSYGTSNGYYYSGQNSTSGFSITPEYRLYLSEKHEAPEGFYVAPYARYQRLKTTGDRYQSLYNPTTGGSTNTTSTFEASLNSFGLGVIVGKHWIFKKRFSIDVFTGPGYTFTDISTNEPGYEPRRGDFVGQIQLGNNNNNYDFRGGASFGIAF